MRKTDGVPGVGDIEVRLQDLSVTVTRALELEILPSTSVELVVDLNASAWLHAVDPVLRIVGEEIFASMISVVAR